MFGTQCVVIAIDARRRDRGWDVYVNGGRRVVEGREAVAWALEATERGLEGAVAKRAASTYQPGRRSRDWMKIKLRNEQEVVGECLRALVFADPAARREPARQDHRLG